MTFSLNAAGAAALFAGSFALHFLLMLAFRNPHRGQFFRSSTSEISASVMMAALLCISIGLMISSLIDSGFAVSHAVAIGGAFGLVAPVLLWRIMKMRARLDAADSGFSPFKLSAPLAEEAAASDTVS
jgi:hypothetical protein